MKRVVGNIENINFDNNLSSLKKKIKKENQFDNLSKTLLLLLKIIPD